MQTKEELSLVKKAQVGDRAALGSLWDDINPKLFGYLVNVLRDKSAAEDVLQETWLAAVKNLHMFQPRGIRFSAWLFAIAKNECRQYWRRTGKQKTEKPIEEFADDAQVSTSENSNDAMYLDSILKKLSKEDQEILRLKYIAGLSFLEIAKVLAISVVAARVRAHRAITRAREYVNI